jgi:hypothetical protein
LKMASDVDIKIPSSEKSIYPSYPSLAAQSNDLRAVIEPSLPVMPVIEESDILEEI